MQKRNPRIHADSAFPFLKPAAPEKVFAMIPYLMIGEVLKPQGLRGECKISPCAADPSLFASWDTVYRKEGDGYAPLSFSLRRVHDGFVYAVLEGCASAEDAERFRGTELYIDRAHAAPLEEGAVYIADLIGCRAVDEEGRELGRLTDVLQYGTVDTWVFAGPRPFMAPALRAVFPEVDAEAKLIRVVSEKLNEVAVFED